MFPHSSINCSRNCFLSGPGSVGQDAVDEMRDSKGLRRFGVGTQEWGEKEVTSL